MGVIKFIIRIIGWLVTIIFQVAGSYLTIFLLSLIVGWVEIQSRLGWLALLFVVWLSYMVGINLVGQAALRWVWKSDKLLVAQRLIGTAVGAIIPLLILLAIGFSVPIGGAGTQYYDLVTNNWQPIMAQASVFAGILGFYLPGLLKSNKEHVIGE
jgi:hypothetical protein